MANHSIRTIVAATLNIITQDNGYVPPSKTATNNTQTKVVMLLNAKQMPDLEPEFFQLADEIIDFYKTLGSSSDYERIKTLPDAPLYEACIKAAVNDEVEVKTLPFVVLMPHLYGKLKPPKPKKLDPIKSEAKLVAPGAFTGIINQRDRFFMKLVRVGAYDKDKGGNLFEVRDRNDNVGIFYELVSRMEDEFQLGDCFAMHATPTRHVTENGEKQTIFRTVEIVDNKGRGAGRPNPADDVTGKFSKGI